MSSLFSSYFPGVFLILCKKNCKSSCTLPPTDGGVAEMDDQAMKKSDSGTKPDHVGHFHCPYCAKMLCRAKDMEHHISARICRGDPVTADSAGKENTAPDSADARKQLNICNIPVRLISGPVSGKNLKTFKSGDELKHN